MSEQIVADKGSCIVKLRRICTVWVLHGIQINLKAGHKHPADDLMKYF